MERSTTKRLDLPAFPRSRPRPPRLVAISSLRDLKLLEWVLLILQVWILVLLIALTLRNPVVLCPERFAQGSLSSLQASGQK